METFNKSIADWPDPANEAQFIQALAENGYLIKQTQLMYGMTDKTTYEPKETNN